MLTTTIFFVAISISGVDVTRIGPYADGSHCHDMQTIIRRDIARSFETTGRYGINADAWGLNTIVMFDDYAINCGSTVYNNETGEVVSEMIYE